jgi:S-DNA-T family DNA segregation ATPase FtsK/SpoIIIE
MTPFTRGRATDTTPVPVRTESVRVGLITIILVWLLRRLASAVVITVRTPLLLAITVVIIGLALLRSSAGSWPALATAVTLAGILVGWRVRWPASFTLIIGNRARSLGRWFWIYRRCWQPAMITANLAQHRDGEEFLPQLLGVMSTR